MKYHLYKGFLLLGEFESIESAKNFTNGMVGIFNLIIPDVFRESWYQF